MDLIDAQILEYLQKNGRISIKKLSKLISLTPPAVANRIRKLEEAGVIIGYRGGFKTYNYYVYWRHRYVV